MNNFILFESFTVLQVEEANDKNASELCVECGQIFGSQIAWINHYCPKEHFKKVEIGDSFFLLTAPTISDLVDLNDIRTRSICQKATNVGEKNSYHYLYLIFNGRLIPTYSFLKT